MAEPRTHWHVAGGPICGRASANAARATAVDAITCEGCRRTLAAGVSRADSGGRRAIRTSRRAHRQRVLEHQAKFVGADFGSNAAAQAEGTGGDARRSSDDRRRS